MSGEKKNPPIKVYGDRILRQKCEEVVFPREDLAQVAASMFLVMYGYNGIGLAANQAGLTDRIAVVNVSPSKSEDEQITLINPVVTWVEGEQNDILEGCLSIPGIWEKRKRPMSCTVDNYDFEGNKHTFTTTGLEARAVLHEIDHLNGELFIDGLPSVQKAMLEGKLKKISRWAKKNKLR